MLKVFSTPQDHAQAILGAIEQLTAPDELADIVHGTTVGTNTLLERKGARVAFVTTAGFEDTLGIGRQARPRPARKPSPFPCCFALPTRPTSARSLRP